MRIWTVGHHGYDILVDGRSIAGYNDYSDSMPDGVDVTDVIQFIVDACNAAEWAEENSEREAGFHAPVSFEGPPASHVDKSDDNPYHRP